MRGVNQTDSRILLLCQLGQVKGEGGGRAMIRDSRDFGKTHRRVGEDRDIGPGSFFGLCLEEEAWHKTDGRDGHVAMFELGVGLL